MSRRSAAIACSLVTSALLTAAVAGVGVRWALSPIANATTVTDERIFFVQPGSSVARVALDLESHSLVRSAIAFKWLARYRGLAGELQAGEYRLSGALAPEEILSRIVGGQVVTYEVILPEGLRTREVADRLEAAGLADAEAFMTVASAPASAAALGVEGDSLEGYLFPETYRLPHGLSADEVAQVLVDQFLQVWREIEPRAREQKLAMREVVILASIVEKETAAAAERPLIASVFRNRLDRGMRLETDPTVIYGIPDFDGNLRRRDLENRANPYNTYLIPGLPPGPIANPGADALRAVINPVQTDYLFFVSRNDGTHIFSKTYAEHNLAVKKYQRRSSR